MQLQKNQMSYWLIRMLNYITSLARGFVSSLYTVLQGVQIWHTLVLQIHYVMVGQLKFLTMAIVSVISPISMIL